MKKTIYLLSMVKEGRKNAVNLKFTDYDKAIEWEEFCHRKGWTTNLIEVEEWE